MRKICILSLAALCLTAVFCAPISAFAATTYIRGDADGDGHVDIRDVTAIQRHLAELEHLNSPAKDWIYPTRRRFRCIWQNTKTPIRSEKPSYMTSTSYRLFRSNNTLSNLK